MKKGFTLKQIKKSILVIFAALFITLPIVSAFAHPGRTDANGGHWNHDTGEYHYHNGEYAGQSSGSSSSSSKYNNFTPDEYKAMGLDDGLKQLCIDTIYLNAYEDGFSSAVSDYCFKHPLFVFVKIIDNRNILHYEPYSLATSDSYVTTRYRWYVERNFDGTYSSIVSYNEGYDYSYKHGNFDNAPLAYKTSLEARQAERKGYTDGYAQFKDANLKNYIEKYSLEAFFTTTYFFYVVAGIIILLIIVTFKIKKAHKEKELAVLDAKNKHDQETKKKIELYKNLKLQIDNIINPNAISTSLLPKYAESLAIPNGDEPKDIFIERYSGTPISLFLELPATVEYIDKNGHITYRGSRAYGDYTVYIASYSGRVIHFRKWCSDACDEHNFLNLPSKYSKDRRCQRCFKNIPPVLLDDDWFNIYKKIVTRKIEYGIDKCQLNWKE